MEGARQSHSEEKAVGPRRGRRRERPGHGSPAQMLTGQVGARKEGGGPYRAMAPSGPSVAIFK